MKKFTLFLFLTCTVLPSYVYAINLNDGQSYTVGSVPGDDIYLGDNISSINLDRWNPSTPGTHLNINDGGTISGIWANHTSTINMIGGNVAQGIQTDDNCQLTVTGGVINGITSLMGESTVQVSNAEIEILSSYDNTSITVNNGSIINQIDVRDNSNLIVNDGSLGEWGIYGTNNASISMYDGSTGHYEIYGSSTGFLYGGSITEAIRASGDATLTMKNGTVKDYTTTNNGLGVIEGGTVENIISVYDDSQINIKGGEILNLLRVFENGVINLYGSGFYVNGESIGYGEGIFEVFGETLDLVGSHYEGRITGTLADGTLLDNDFYIYNSGSWEGTADIYIIPEPATLSLLALGAFLAGRRRRLKPTH